MWLAQTIQNHRAGVTTAGVQDFVHKACVQACQPCATTAGQTRTRFGMLHVCLLGERHLGVCMSVCLPSCACTCTPTPPLIGQTCCAHLTSACTLHPVWADASTAAYANPYRHHTMFGLRKTTR